MFSWDSFCAISQAAGLSSLLWHRKTSKISALVFCSLTKGSIIQKRLETAHPIPGSNSPQCRARSKDPNGRQRSRRKLIVKKRSFWRFQKTLKKAPRAAVKISCGGTCAMISVDGYTVIPPKPTQDTRGLARANGR